MSSWERMNKVIERYERLAMGQIRKLKQLQRKIIDRSCHCENITRHQAFQMEEQLVSGLQQLLALRSELEISDQETFDVRIEPIRKQIQTLVAVNKQLPVNSSYEDTKPEDEPNPYEMEGKRYLQQVDSRAVEARARAEEAKSMAEATLRLNKDMQDIETIFTELATIVHQQHDMVDSIEEHVERAAQDTHRGHQELKKAVKYKTAKAPLVAAVIGGLAVGGPVGIAAGSAIAGVAAGVGGLVAGVYGGKWFKNSVQRDLEEKDK